MVNMSLATSIAKIGEVIATWLDPTRREIAVLKGAIESAEQLLMIERKQDRYAKMEEKQLNKYRVHYQKRFDAWRDGK